MNEDQKRARIVELTAAIDVLAEERQQLRKELSFPNIEVEARYWRYHSEYVEICDSVEDAFSFLNYGEEMGDLSADGVYVNGVKQPTRRADDVVANSA